MRGGSLQPQVPSTSSSVVVPYTSSHLVGLAQSDPLKIIPRGHVPHGKLALLSSIIRKFIVVFLQVTDCAE